MNFVDPRGLSTIVFDRSDNTIIIYPGEGVNNTPLRFPASNRTTNPNADPYLPGGFGPAPSGTFSTGGLINTGQGPNDPFGSFFIPITLPLQPPYAIPRTGVGLHSGRASSPRGPGFHQTRGCIRTTEDAGDTLRADPPTSITIVD